MRNSGIVLSSLSPRVQAQVTAALHGTRPQAPAPTGPFTVWVPYHVPSLNTLLGKNYRVLCQLKRKAAEAWHNATDGRPGSAGPGRLHLIVTCFVIQPRDADNICVKHLVDAIRHAGYLRNDDPASMALTINPEVRVSKRKEQGTRVTIAPSLP